MPEYESSRRSFIGFAGKSLAITAAATAVPATALARTEPAGVDPATGEPLDAGVDCDRGAPR
ncbi:hypothetical protein FB471_6219 [Amycolatopsis cihanbeyliensis]|uniref:Uncharacterized protein n=1 Tax=Amycolatopsis cihanbeyliensis TaxID=1128664 RepID=A0A542CTA9_AMYCI|nr:hypothetical protein FB471_6219 [Amycolatopsis cihanbeyliensis]